MKSPDIPNDTVPDFCASANLVLARPILEKIADKWTVMILTAVSYEPKRFNQIKRQLGITHKALADSLKRLERSGLVTRTVLPTSPISVEYAITELGISLKEPFHSLCGWALSNASAIKASEELYDENRKTQR